MTARNFSIPSFFGACILKACGTSLSVFSASIEIIMWFLSLSYLCDLFIIVFWILSQLCICGVEPTWSWWMIFVIYDCIQLAHTLLMIFAYVFTRDIGLEFLPWLCLYLTLVFKSSSCFSGVFGFPKRLAFESMVWVQRSLSTMQTGTVWSVKGLSRTQGRGRTTVLSAVLGYSFLLALDISTPGLCLGLTPPLCRVSAFQFG